MKSPLERKEDDDEVRRVSALVCEDLGLDFRRWVEIAPTVRIVLSIRRILHTPLSPDPACGRVAKDGDNYER